MQVYLGDQDTTLTIPLADKDGNLIEALTCEYRVIDQDEVVLVAKTTLDTFVASDVEATVTVLAANNALGTAARALRLVELYLTTASGVTTLAHEYIIEAPSVLEAGTNSFQNYPTALLVGYEIPNLPAWSLASKDEKIVALKAAWRNFSRIGLRFLDESIDITKLSKTSFLALNAEYREALSRAQVIEADYLLGGDETGDLRRSGVMSATVGESSQFFRTTKPLETALCKRAMKEIARYIITTVKVGRA